MSTKNPGPVYPSLKPWDLEPHLSVHRSAMTTEGLHGKAEIAEQLAWRDRTIADLRGQLARSESTVRMMRQIIDDHGIDTNLGLP